MDRGMEQLNWLHLNGRTKTFEGTNKNESEV